MKRFHPLAVLVATGALLIVTFDASGQAAKALVINPRVTPAPGIAPNPGVAPAPGAAPAPGIAPNPGFAPSTGLTPNPAVTPNLRFNPGTNAGMAINPRPSTSQ